MSLSATKELLKKVIQASSLSIHITPQFYFAIEVISNLQSLSLIMIPLYVFCQNNMEDSVNITKHIAYYLHFAQIFGNEITFCTALISFYLASLLILLLSLSKILALGLTLHSKVLFYCIHYFLIQSLTNSSGIIETTILIILTCVNFALVLFKEIFLLKPLRTKQISSSNNCLYPLIILLQKSLIICLLFFLENPKTPVLALNIILSLISLYLALETLPFYNLSILRINIVFTTLSFSFSVMIIPEVNGVLSGDFFMILAVSSLLVKISLIKLNCTLQKVIQMKSKNPKAAILLPSLFQEWIKKLNVIPNKIKFPKETLLISGFLPDALQEFAEEDTGKALENLKLRSYTVILGYFNKLRVKNPNNELLLLNIASLYTKVQDIPKAMEILNYLKSTSPSLAVESVINQLSNDLKQRNKSESYESYFEHKNRIMSLKRQIQNEVSEQISFWKLLAEKNLNVKKVYTKALKISQLSQQIQRYWQVYFQENEGTNFELAVNYGYYLDIVQGLGHQGLKLIKNAYKLLHNRAHTRIAEDNRSGAILVVSIEPERQGKILNTCHSAKSLFEGSLIGMDINSIIPKAFCAKNHEKISQLDPSSKFNTSQHPASYVRTLDGHYFKAQIAVHLNSSMDQGLSFVVHVRRLSSENESLIIADSHNKITDFSRDIGQALNLTGKEHIDTLCPDFKKLKATPWSLKEKHEKTFEAKFVSQENEPTEAGRELLLSSPGREENFHLLTLASPKIRAISTEDGCKMISTHPSFWEDEPKQNEPKILQFNILNKNNTQKMKFKVIIENINVFGGSSFRVLKFHSPCIIPPRLPLAEDLEEDAQPNSPSQRENRRRSDIEYQQRMGMVRKITLHKIEHKSVKKAESVASSQFSAKVLAKSLITLFRENKINRLTRITIQMIYLTVFIVILTATIDSISTESSLKNMQNAINLVDLINKRLYKGVFAWQTALFIMTFAFGVNSPPSRISGLQRFVKSAVLDTVENNNLLQKQITLTNEKEVIESLYNKSIVMWDPQDEKASYFDSFRANEILAQKNMFIANFNGTATKLQYEPDALSAVNNTANSYLLEAENSIKHVTSYFLRTKENNVEILKIIFSLKLVAISLLFLFICKLFQNIILSSKRLFKFLSKVPQATINNRINQLEILKPYFDVENSSIFEDSQNKIIKKSSLDLKYNHRNKSFILRELIIYMAKYLVLSLLLIIPSTIVFAVSYKEFQRHFSDLEKINEKMLISYRLGTQAGMILPSFFFYQSFHSYSNYTIREIPPLDQFYLSVNQLNKANEILLNQILTSADDDKYVHNLLTSNICDYVTSDSTRPCSDGTNSNSKYGLLDINSKYYLVATQGMTRILEGKTSTARLDTYSQILKDVYLALAVHFLDLFEAAVHTNLSESSYHLKLNFLIILISTILVRVFVLVKFKEIDIGMRKILRLIPYQIIEEQKHFMQYLKKEFHKELEKNQGKSSKY